ncbi:MAG: indole-3-glycerol phosphate synthase TrpC [Actinobacteria bacterium]|nr:indole-3-glycerol phosphate synthase TrpC [Actinomycetota bacterium]
MKKMFLDDAVEAAMREARERMELFPVALLERIVLDTPTPPDFKGAVTSRGDGVRIIAEIKRSSPSRGAIREDVSVASTVSAYLRGGASAVSVLTCAYRFGGSMGDLARATSAARVPVLRKDFITEPYQVLEARARGASAVLLIAAALDAERIRELTEYAAGLGMECLVEVHSAGDVGKALEGGAEIIGINNRDLRTLEVDLGTTGRVMPYIPPGTVVVSESGVTGREQVKRLEDMGVDAVLIGEALMRAEDPVMKIRELLGEVDERCGSRSVE